MRIRMLAFAGTIIGGYVTLLVAMVAGPPRVGHPGKQGAVSRSDESEIRELLAAQADAWNRGDIDSFMTSYRKSDETAFVGATGVARGWDAVLERYHRAYPSRESMGHVSFSNVEVHQECADTAFAIGQYHLDRAKDHPSGVFTLDLRKFAEGWRIVLDHTTAFPAQTGKPQ